MKYSFVKEIREMNLQFYDLKNLLLVLSNMGEKDFKRVYKRLKNSNNRDVFVSLVLKLILNKYGSLDDVFKIMDKLEQLSFNDNALKLVYGDFIYIYRSVDEILESMDKVSEETDFLMFYDVYILRYRNHSEHMKLIEKAKLYRYKSSILMIARDENILKNKLDIPTVQYSLICKDREDILHPTLEWRFDNQTQYITHLVNSSVIGENYFCTHIKLFNGKEIEDYTSNVFRDDFGPYTIPNDCYFMMGDNRSNSWDSRYWDNKYVSESEIIGKAEIEYYPEIKVLR